MERERFNPNYVNLEQENRTNELVDGLIVKFEEEYQGVYQGTENKAILYAGDYLYDDPKTLILARKPETLTVEHSKLFNYFLEIFGDDVIGNPYTQRIKKNPEPETLFLAEFIKTNRKKEFEQLDVSQTYFNLKPSKEGLDLVMTIDQYLMPDVRMNIPVSEVWHLRKYDNGYNSDSKVEKDTCKIIPRSAAALLKDEK